MMCVSMASLSIRRPPSRECCHTGTFHSASFSPPHVVDEHVKAALLVLYARYERFHLSRCQEIDPNGDAAPASPIDEFGRLLDRLGAVVLRALPSRGAPRYVDRRPGGSQLDGYPAPGPSRPPATRATLPSNRGVM